MTVVERRRIDVSGENMGIGGFAQSGEM